MGGDVVPAVIPQSFTDLEEKIAQVKGLVDRVQIDVFDGTFSPSRNWPYNNPDDEHFVKLKNGELTLPFSNELILEIDVTLSEPEKHVEEWIQAGAKAIVVHIEKVEDMASIIRVCRDAGVSVGIALSPQTENEKVYPWVSEIESVQFMGNQKVGYHGVELNPDVLDKIKAFKNYSPDTTLAIDIGVNLETAPALARAGITRLVSGSAIFNSEKPEETIEQFRAILKSSNT